MRLDIDMSMLDDPTRLLPGGSELLARLAALELRVATLEVAQARRCPAYKVRWDRFGDEWRNYGRGWVIDPQDREPWKRAKLEKQFGPTTKVCPENVRAQWGADPPAKVF